MKHTNGPWKSFLVPYSAQRQVRDESEELIIAVIPSQKSKAQCDADAQLIAAAPDLLEALELAEYNLREVFNDSSKIMPVIQKAIKKAKGKL